MTLANKTSEMTTHTLRNVVGEIIGWANKHMGVKNVKYRVLTQRSKCKVYYGEYFWENKTIHIYRNNCPTIKHLITTVLHEYRHALQDMNNYHHVLEKVGYKKHPLEVEARESEKRYSTCWRSIKKKL